MAFEHAVMAAIQSAHDLLGGFGDFLFSLFTFMGEETFLLAVIVGIYWCLDKHLGERLLLILYASVGLNGVLKDLVRRPRPFLTPGFEDLRYVRIENPLVNTVHLAHSFSFPSGHSMCSASLFGGLAQREKKPAVWFWCLLAVLAVMSSRLYLGVHVPTDVLVGGVLGLVLALVFGWLFDRFYEKRLLLFTAVVAFSALGLLFSPTPDTVKTIGVGVGALIGLVWEQRFDFSVQGSTGRRFARLLLGVALLMALRVGLKLIFPAGLVFDGLRYCVLGFAATGLWPWMFTKFDL